MNFQRPTLNVEVSTTLILEIWRAIFLIQKKYISIVKTNHEFPTPNNQFRSGLNFEILCSALDIYDSRYFNPNT